MKQTALALALTGWVVGCDNAPPPPSTILAATISTEQREVLSPAVRQLLSDIESGKAAGAIAANYTEALNEAGEVTEGRKEKEYIIVLDGNSEAESHPCIFVRVNKENGLVKRCGTCVPIW